MLLNPKLLVVINKNKTVIEMQSNNVIPFPQRGKLGLKLLSGKVVSADLKQVLFYVTDEHLRRSLLAALRTEQDGKCLLDFTELVELRSLGMPLQVVR